MMVFALLCWGSSLLIPHDRRGRARPAHLRQHRLARPARCCAHLRDDTRLWWGALVMSWFWLVGAVVLSLLPPLVKTVLGGTEEVVTLFLAVFSVAIAVGSGLAAWLSAGRIVLLPTPVGAVAAGLFALDLGWTTYGTPPALVADRRRRRVRHRAAACGSTIDFAGLAISGGLYIVPTFAAVQAWAGADRARPRHRRRQRAQRRLHGRPAPSSSRRCRRSTSRRRCCSSWSASPTFGVAVVIAAPCRPARSATSSRSCSAPSTASR